MYKYGNAENTFILSEDGTSIPVSGGNRHYQEVMDWVAQGNTIEPYVAPPLPTPTSVTPRQARLALFQAGLLEAVEAAIAAADKPTQVTWEYAIEFRRDDPMINALGTQLGLTSQQIDQLFIVGSQYV